MEPRVEIIQKEHDRSPTVGEPNTDNERKLEETPRFYLPLKGKIKKKKKQSTEIKNMADQLEISLCLSLSFFGQGNRNLLTVFQKDILNCSKKDLRCS